MFKAFLSCLTLVLGLAVGPAFAADIFATSVTSIFRGDTTIGNFPGYYGGNFPGVFPVALTEAQARAAVLGAPNGSFLSLPGNEAADPTPSGTGFKWAYVEVAFGSNFTAADDLVIWELGANLERARLFVWFADGGNVQFDVTRPATDDFAPLVVDLSPYAALVAAHGGSFTRVGIGGQDLLGGSQGFDLDAVAISPIPEPEIYAMLAAGLGVMGFVARRRKQGATA